MEGCERKSDFEAKVASVQCWVIMKYEVEWQIRWNYGWKMACSLKIGLRK